MRTTRSTRPARLTALLSTAVLAVGLSACGADETTDSAGDPSASASPTTSTAADEAASLTVEDPWVKSAAEGMTAAFGTLVNDGDSDITVVSATSDITDMMELHETVENSDGSMAMQPKDGGFTVPAGGEHELAPGGDHLMVMGLTRAIEPGETVTFTLTLDDGSTTEVEATVKDFTGADEEYQNGEDSGMDMDMGDDSGDSGDS